MCKYGLAANGFYLQDKNSSHVPRLGSLACCVKGCGGIVICVDRAEWGVIRIGGERE